MSLSLISQQKKLPSCPGVYLFLDKAGRVIYIGKAAVLKTRVASYLRPNTDRKTSQLVERARKIKRLKTGTALEALFLEAKLIKKHQPQYNIKQKDDKTSAYLIITREKFPRLEITRPTALHRFKIKKSYGPFASKKEIEQALKILRRVFPYHSLGPFKKPCFHYQIGLCPGPCAGKITPKLYQKNIKNLCLIFQGKKSRVISRLKKQMRKLSREQNFEKAAAIRDTILSLKNLQDINPDQKQTVEWKIIKNIPQRLEAYDISNLGGKYATGSMVVFTYGRPDKAEYRKFKIRPENPESQKIQNGPDDTGMLRHVLKRRFNNNWPRPSVIFIDGGLGQIRAAQETLHSLGLKIPIFSAAKGPGRKNFRVYKSHKNIQINRDLLKQASAEAHRFAIKYHQKLREKNFSSF
ncbi:MAG: UvrB/UvrC motif-containing protein [Patescibacteria group bacterium]|nr:UvrB/UvrC motif-containing protein [Patescibacteria group bacterium]